MATMHYYSDTPNGAVRLDGKAIMPMDRKEWVALFGAQKGLTFGSCQMYCGRVMAGESTDGAATYLRMSVLPVTRAITFKDRPSLHECSAKCQNATGKQCECSCRGRNHGGH